MASNREVTPNDDDKVEAAWLDKIPAHTPCAAEKAAGASVATGLSHPVRDER
jgi:hypothetical protein